jgi:hypothetical protein
MPARDYGLGRHPREPGAHELDHLRDREAVRQRGRLGASIGTASEQLESAARRLGSRVRGHGFVPGMHSGGALWTGNLKRAFRTGI